MIAEIITSGTELLLGDTVDTNSAYIARALRDIGVNLYLKTSVGDNIDRLSLVLTQALDRADAVIITGGLGPTVDDVTREAVAQATGRQLRLRPECLADVEAIFARWGRPVGDNNRRQAFLPEGAQPIHNDVGTAPGFILETERGAVIALPGVPREMERLMQVAVLPYLVGKLGADQVVIKSRILRTAGLGESVIDERIDQLMRGENPTVGLSAHLGVVDVRITARAATSAGADAMIATIEAEVRARIGEQAIFGAGQETLEEVTARTLSAAGVSLALVESATGGELARLLRGVPDGGRLVRAGHVVSNTDELAALVGVPRAPLEAFGWVSQMSATAAAAALVDTYEDGWGLAVLSDPHDHGDVYREAPGSTIVALATSRRTEVQHLPFGGDGLLARRWVVTRVLNLLRVAAINQMKAPAAQPAAAGL